MRDVPPRGMTGQSKCIRRLALLLSALVWVHHLSSPAHGANVLVLNHPAANTHIASLNSVATELASRGHRVLVSASVTDAGFYREDQGYEVLWYGRNNKTELTFVFNRGEPPEQLVPRINAMANEKALPIFLAEHFEALQSQRIDLVLTDYIFEGGLVVALKLDSLTAIYYPVVPWDRHLTGVKKSSIRRGNLPVNLAYLPLQDGAPTPKSFFDRVRNSLHYLHSLWVDVTVYQPGSDKLQRVHGVDFGSPRALAQRTLWISPADFAWVAPRPLPPHFKFVGPLLLRPPQPLPPDLQAFVDAQPEGFLVVSFGSIQKLTVKEQELFLRAFEQLQLGVVWKLSEEETEGSPINYERPNLKVMPWLPQGDLLAHPKARAFLSHCGLNSVYEAVARGIPIIGVPGFADQNINARRVVEQGVGVNLADGPLTTKAVRAAILKVVGNDSYRQRAQQIGRLLSMRRRTSQQEAADHLEYALATNGSTHLQPAEDVLPFWVVHGLDVQAFWLCVALATSYSLACTGRAALQVVQAAQGAKVKAL